MKANTFHNFVHSIDIKEFNIFYFFCGVIRHRKGHVVTFIREAFDQFRSQNIVASGRHVEQHEYIGGIRPAPTTQRYQKQYQLHVALITTDGFI